MCDKIGFDTCQLLLNCGSVEELDNSIRVINNFYRIYREHLSVLDEIKSFERMGLSVSMVKLNGPKK